MGRDYSDEDRTDREREKRHKKEKHRSRERGRSREPTAQNGVDKDRHHRREDKVS